MKLLGSSTNRITKDRNDKNIPHLEITEVLLVPCNIVKNDYQQDSTVLNIFSLNKLSKNLFIKVWFTNQNSRPQEIEDRINLTLVSNNIQKIQIYPLQNEIFN